MVEDFGIVGAELVGLQEQIEGVIVAAHLEVDPAEGVEIGGVVGGELEGGLDMAEGFI